MPTDRDIIDNVDGNGTDATSIENRLNAALNVQQVVTKRLTAIKPSYPDPGPPGAPTTLRAIITEAQATITLAQSMLATRG
jgi:hypothetical protein